MSPPQIVIGNIACSSIQYVQDIVTTLDVELNNIIGPLAHIVDEVKEY
jgi:hypothetical protein